MKANGQFGHVRIILVLIIEIQFLSILKTRFIHSVLEEELGLKNLLAGSSINFVNKVAAIKELEISKGIAGHAGNGTSGCFPTTVNPMKRKIMSS